MWIFTEAASGSSHSKVLEIATLVISENAAKNTVFEIILLKL